MMKTILFLLGMVTAIQLTAQTVTQTNNSNPAISPNLVIGNSFTVTVHGDPGLQVATDSILGHFVDGTTDGNGNWTGNGTAANVGNWSLTYSVGGVAAAPSPLNFQVDGPANMVVTRDVLGKCNSCTTTVVRDVTYQVFKLSGSNVGSIPICESVQLSNWNCSQPDPGGSINACNVNNGVTTASGQFTDEWTLNSDRWTPAGCGFGSIVDTWKYPFSNTIIVPFGTLNGAAFTNSIRINGCTQPGCSLVGQRFGP